MQRLPPHILSGIYIIIHFYTCLFAERRELKHRQVKHFGFEFKYGINDVDADDPLPQGIPPVCSNFLQRALATGHVTHYPDQLTVNQYQPGQGRKCLYVCKYIVSGLSLESDQDGVNTWKYEKS